MTTNGDGRGRGAREGHGLDVNPRSVRCDPRCWTARGAVDKNRGGSRRGGACWRVSERRGADLTGHPQALSPDPNGFRALFARGALCQSQVMTNPRSTQRIYRDREFCAVQMPRSPNAKSSHIFSLICLSHLVQLRRFDWPKPLGSKNRGEKEPDDCAKTGFGRPSVRHCGSARESHERPCVDAPDAAEGNDRPSPVSAHRLAR